MGSAAEGEEGKVEPELDLCPGPVLLRAAATQPPRLKLKPASQNALSGPRGTARGRGDCVRGHEQAACRRDHEAP